MDQTASDLPSIEELQESIDELSAYRERLFQDVVGLGKKLRLSQKKIDSTVAEHEELQRLDEVMSQLVAQRDSQQSKS
jgi:dimeric dUTPase (all-alpha-NTP-PPase superfamily)